MENIPPSPEISFARGDRECFRLQIEFTPDPSPQYADFDLVPSWGSFQFWVGGRNLCRHHVQGLEYDSVSWYLLPMLEWFVLQWDYLFHEERPPADNADSVAWRSLGSVNNPLYLERGGEWDFETHAEIFDWCQRHCLSACAEGGYFPDVVLRRYWDEVEVSWGDIPPPGCPDGFRFSSAEGVFRVDPAHVAESLREVIFQAVSALKAATPNSKRVLGLEKKIRELESPDRIDRRIGIMAGLGKKAKDWTRRWIALKKKLVAQTSKPTLVENLFGGDPTGGLYVRGNCRGALMFGSASPSLNEEDVLSLAKLLVMHANANKKEDRLRTFAKHVPVEASNNAPWLQGYQLATQWADYAGISINAEHQIDVEAHLVDWGVRVHDITLNDEEIGGVAISSEERSPLIALNRGNLRNQYPSGRRFSLAHELCHLLFDRRLGVDLALISGPWAPRDVEKRANAFAAMFLMPDALVESAFEDVGTAITRPDPEMFVEVAKLLGVSVDALAHHMCNRGWISAGAREFLLTASFIG